MPNLFQQFASNFRRNLQRLLGGGTTAVGSTPTRPGTRGVGASTATKRPQGKPRIPGPRTPTLSPLKRERHRIAPPFPSAPPGAGPALPPVMNVGEGGDLSTLTSEQRGGKQLGGDWLPTLIDILAPGGQLRPNDINVQAATESGRILNEVLLQAAGEEAAQSIPQFLDTLFQGLTDPNDKLKVLASMWRNEIDAFGGDQVLAAASLRSRLGDQLYQIAFPTTDEGAEEFDPQQMFQDFLAGLGMTPPPPGSQGAGPQAPDTSPDTGSLLDPAYFNLPYFFDEGQV